jgi:hypothetical protein
LGYGDAHELGLGANGTITALPAVGTIVERGGTVAEVDGRAITLWYGQRPFWRALGREAATGADVRQLEENLVALGFGSGLTVDDELTSRTVTVIKAWQKASGREQTGVVELGDVVVQTGAVRVAGQPSQLGAPAGGGALSVTGTQRIVAIDLDASRQSLLGAGDVVKVVLPDGSTADATVYSVGTVAEVPANGQGNPTIAVVVVINDPARSGQIDSAPVTVRVTTTAATGVLAVPVRALLALSEGGYAVERVQGASRSLVGVELGSFADGFVEVTTGLSEGDVVTVPG